tara:strand:+ start:2006 stop:2263 length:258 start_codon:yes stop_codon:yes gene_type:complete
MQSGRGNDIANQFEIFTEEGVYFQSYRTIIAFKATGQVYLDEGSWDYSMTTGKYRNIFLGEDKKETNRKIKAGVYKLVNLNESSI